MEIKGKIKEISISETQAKVKLEDGMVISSNMPFVRAAVQQLAEGNDIVADVYVNPGTGKWAGRTFYNINNIALDLPVIQRKDELKEPEKPVETKTTTPEPQASPPPETKQEEVLAYTPESATMEMGRLWIQLLTASKEFFKVFKK